MILISITLAYLIGSIPNAVWIGKVFYGKDVRNEGSKNAGATNVIRVLGLKPGLCVLVLDLLKGVIPLAVFSFFIKGDWYGYYLLEIAITQNYLQDNMADMELYPQHRTNIQDYYLL